ncbi:Carbohydrate esterase 4 protein [Tulasnella sp. 418]|nr:Carbohydrate esterase 4 protein [Tulasnella sp. 418]
MCSRHTALAAYATPDVLARLGFTSHELVSFIGTSRCYKFSSVVNGSCAPGHLHITNAFLSSFSEVSNYVVVICCPFAAVTPVRHCWSTFATVKNNTVALTFDDGPFWYGADISKVLLDNGGKGTFFLNGPNWACIYDNNGKGIKDLYDQGHQIANHPWSHPHINSLTSTQMTNELSKVDEAIQRITGAVPAWIRPPYGEYNDLFREVAYLRGQSLAIWDFDSGDSIGTSPADSEALYLSTINQNPKNILALNHETYSSTANDVIPYAVNLLKSKGYSMVTLAECLGLPAYLTVGSLQTPDSSWHC